MSYITPSSYTHTPKPSVVTDPRIRLTLWSAVCILIILSILYIIFQGVHKYDEHAYTLDQLQKKSHHADITLQEAMRIHKDEQAYHRMRRLETLMTPHAIKTWCEEIPQKMGLNYNSPLLSIECQYTQGSTKQFSTLLNFLSQGDKKEDASLYHPIQMRLLIKTYTESVFFKILDMLRDTSPFYMEIHTYTLTRMDASQHASLIPESVQDLHAPFFQGTIDMHALSLWDEDPDAMTHDEFDHDGRDIMDDDGIEPHTDPPTPEPQS